MTEYDPKSDPFYQSNRVEMDRITAIWPDAQIRVSLTSSLHEPTEYLVLVRNPIDDSTVQSNKPTQKEGLEDIADHLEREHQKNQDHGFTHFLFDLLFSARWHGGEFGPGPLRLMISRHGNKWSIGDQHKSHLTLNDALVEEYVRRCSWHVADTLMYSKYEVNAQGDGFHAKLFVGENGEGILEADASNMDDCLRELAVQLAKHDIAGYWSTPAPEASANG